MIPARRHRLAVLAVLVPALAGCARLRAHVGPGELPAAGVVATNPPDCARHVAAAHAATATPDSTGIASATAAAEMSAYHDCLARAAR